MVPRRVRRRRTGPARLCPFAALATLALLAAAPAAAQQRGMVRGRVLVAETATPLSGASVLITGAARGALTGTDGAYRLVVPAGTHTVRATMLGYETIEHRINVLAGATATVDFELPQTALAIGELIVVGSRTARTAVETPVPVDVVSAPEIELSGHTETNQLLAHIVPSFNASHQTIADGTDHVNPASLRGLGPDQVLVLLNGKRRHQSALVHVNGTFGRGTVGVDMNAIPTAAIDRIEVLRDGAAAQYGSDAIAGVINVVLKQRTDEIAVDGVTGVTGEGDGEQVQASVNYGFGVGDRGFFNITGEFLNRERTDRSGEYTGQIFRGITDAAATDAELRRRGLTRRDFSMKIGQGEAAMGAAFFNSALPLGADAELYAFGGASLRKGMGTGFYRLPFQEERVVPELYPNGFLPEIHTWIDDRAITAGVRGTRNGWDLDFGVTHGRNGFRFNIENTNNASMGPASPTSFDAGGFRFGQTVGNFDAVRPLDIGGVRSLSLVVGAEFRHENYRIEAGEEASWQLGNGGDRPGIDYDTSSTGAPKSPGSQVFPGFRPSNALNRSRYSAGAYAGLETRLSDRTLVDVGGRYESYSDFGRTATGKLAARHEAADGFALRGAVSTGFRAPSLHQMWFNHVSIQFLLDEATGELVPRRVLTAHNQSPVTRAFGMRPLEEETSVSVSAGFTARPTSNLSITADIYQVGIDDRIVLSSRFGDSDPIVARILAPFERQGVGQAQFFANAVDTRTRGIDIVAAYATELRGGTLNLTGATNLTRTEVLRTNVPQGIADRFAGGDLDAVKTTLFNREERNRLETALPRRKAHVGATYTHGGFTFRTGASYFGEVLYRPTNPDNDEDFSPKSLVDVDLSYRVAPGVRLSAGATNVFNTFPDPHAKPANRSSNRFIYSRRVTQFGMNGGFYYVRLRLRL